MVRIHAPTTTSVNQTASTSSGTAASQAPAPQARQRSTSLPLQAFRALKSAGKSAGRALRLSGSTPKTPNVQKSLGALMHEERSSKLTRSYMGVPQPGDSQPSSKASSPAVSRAPSERAPVFERGEPSRLTKVKFAESALAIYRAGASESESLSTRKGGGKETEVPLAAHEEGRANTQSPKDLGINKAAEILEQIAFDYGPGALESMLKKGELPQKALEKGAPYGVTQNDFAAVVKRLREFQADAAELEEHHSDTEAP